MSAMEKVNNILGKLPFVKLAGNIPEGIRGKIPFLNVLIPFANHIASGAAIVVLVACFGGGGGVASGKDFSYELYDDDSLDVWVSDDDGSHGVDVSISAGITITDYSGNGGKVVIPATIEGYPVRAIGRAAFRGSYESNSGWRYTPAHRITELVIPEGVEYIGDVAFVGCENLKTVTLPASLKGIDMRAFDSCPNLENLNIPASASFACSFDAFGNKKLPLKTRQRLVELGHLNF